MLHLFFQEQLFISVLYMRHNWHNKRYGTRDKVPLDNYLFYILRILLNMNSNARIPWNEFLFVSDLKVQNISEDWIWLSDLPFAKLT